jgi:hypothetical protein
MCDDARDGDGSSYLVISRLFACRKSYPSRSAINRQFKTRVADVAQHNVLPMLRQWQAVQSQ